MRISASFIILLGLLGSVSSLAQQSYPYYGQNFVVHYFDDTYWVNQCNCPQNVGSESTLNLAGGKPLVVDVTTECARSGLPNYFKYCSYDLNTPDCYTDSYISWEPYNLTSPGSGGAFCSNQKITLNAPNAYQGYVWQYSIQTGVWNSISSQTSNSIAVGIQDIFGSNYSSHFNQNIYFRYSVSSCSPISLVSGAYTFAPPQIKGSYVPIAPTCANGSDGSVTITMDRDLLSGEQVLSVDFHTANDVFSSMPYQIASPSVSGRTIVVNGIASGQYYVYIKNSLGYCGTSVDLTPSFTIPSGPRNPLSASLSVTSNYNSSQLSCSSSSDGQLTVSTNGGGNGNYTYSLDGSAYQSSTIFSGVSSGGHSVTVKDGCGTPTTATTNSVTITPPASVSISSLTPSLCNGSSDGTITVSASGGTGSLSYSSDGSTFQGSNVFAGLSPGNYTITVKDANNCTNTGSVTVPSAVNAGTVNVTHPTCSGTGSGKISVSGSNGGSGSYQYSIDGTNYFTSSVFSSVSPGIYTVTVKDANGCTATINSVVVNAPITATYSTTDASCSTVNDGSITVSGATGGTGSYTYSLDGTNYQPSNIFSGKGSGSYTIYVKDGNGCIYTMSNATIGQLPAVSGAITQTSFINCYGQSTAAFNVVASGGTSPYTNYSWTNGASGPSVNNVGAGGYSVTITDSKGCQSTAGITIAQPAQLSGTLIASNYNGFNVACKGGNSGTLTLTPAGGTSPYSFAWNTGSISQNLSALTAGGYSVTITDANSCNTVVSTTLTEPPSSVGVVLQNKNDITCFGANNGTITVTGSGGTGALSYSKDGTTYQLSNSFASLPSGNYTITAKDANSCAATTSGIIINTPTVLSITSITKVNPDCYGSSTGSLQVTASGGTMPYQYSIDGVNYVTTSTLSSLPSGSYVVTVKDANGCTKSSASQALVDPAQLTASYISTAQSCSANTDGSITVNASGGTGTLSYSINGTTYQASPVFNNLTAGPYTVTIKDASNCTKNISATVGIVTALSGTVTQTSFISCYGQATASLSLASSGGTAPYSYSWTNGAVTQNVSSLAAGSYSVVITDSKNCSLTKSATVTQPAILTASQTSSGYNGYGVSCSGAADGFINLTVTGGTSPYTYAWSNGAATKNISALAVGNYTVTVTDSKNCTANQAQLITAPPVLSATAIKTNVSCNGGNDGTITVNASGGAGTYSYSINGGSSWQTSNTFTSQIAGTYTIQTKDQNNCTTTAGVTITQPTAVTINIGTIQNAGCNQTNGSIQASASGGTGTLSYTWRDATNQIVGTAANLSNVGSGTYTLTVSDQNNCSMTATAGVSNPSGPMFNIINQVATTCSYSSDGQATASITSGQSPLSVSWGNGETGNTATHLLAGSNTITVTDGNNCLTTQNFTIAAPPAIALSNEQAASPSCPSGNDGSIQVTVAGGTAPYSYSWNGTSGGNTIAGLTAGSYDLQVTDAKNCVLTKTINITDVPVIAINVVNQVTPTCFANADGSLVVQATGGNGSYNYSWDTGASGAQLNSIGGGDYKVTVKDNKNCVQNKTITMTAPAAVTATLTPGATACNGGIDGQINVSAAGGTGTYTYTKDNGNTWQSQSNFTGLSAGIYTIQTKDQNGCSQSSQTTVTEPTAITINTNKTDPTCNLANGSAHATVTGGTGSYNYQWINSANQTASTTSDLQNAGADTYMILVNDANQCTATGSVILNAYPSAQFTVTNIGSATCSYSADGSATLQVAFAQSPYTIAWSSGEATATAIKLLAGQNTITVTDVNGCDVTKTFLVPSPVAISVLAETITNPTCAGGSDGVIQVTATGGTGLFSYSWNGAAGTNSLANIKAGTYNLTITDANNCSFTKSYSIVDPTRFTIDLGADEVICPKTTAQIGLTLPNATYSWSGPNGFTSTAGIVNVGDAGTYQLTIINADGCQANDQIAISISNNLLKADFLTVSKAYAGDTLILIDISWPLPEGTQWQLGDSATIYYTDKDYALISYAEAGTYTVGVKATLGGCSDEYFQKIIIDKKVGGVAEHKGGTPAVNHFVAYPNPFDGKTNARIELSEQGEATMKVYNLQTNLEVMSHRFEGGDKYEAELDFTGREAGLYIIVLEVGITTKAVRVIKL